MDAYTETIKSDRLEVASFLQMPFPGPSTVSEFGKKKKRSEEKMPQLHTQTGCSEAPVTPQGLEPVKSERASPGEKETWRENQPSNEQKERVR